MTISLLDFKDYFSYFSVVEKILDLTWEIQAEDLILLLISYDLRQGASPMRVLVFSIPK